MLTLESEPKQGNVENAVQKRIFYILLYISGDKEMLKMQLKKIVYVLLYINGYWFKWLMLF